MNTDDFISSTVNLVSNAATLTPFRPFLGILFKRSLTAGVGLNPRVGEPTINNSSPVNCSGLTSPTRSISTSSGEPRALPIAWAICSVFPKNES